jgi:hypothetical protein
MPNINITNADTALLQLAEEILKLEEVPRTIVERAVPKLARVIDQEFVSGAGPDGTPWAPLKDGSGRTPLNRSGRTRAGVRVTAEGRKIKASFPNVMNILQSQSKKPGLRAARPVGWRSELPAHWAAAIQEAADEVKAEVEARIEAAAK